MGRKWSIWFEKLIQNMCENFSAKMESEVSNNAVMLTIKHN